MQYKKILLGILTGTSITAAALFTSLVVPTGTSQTVSAAVLTPKSGTSDVAKNDKGQIDYSNVSDGYVIVKYTGGKDVRIKAQVAKSGGTTYTYNINNKGTTEVLPITEGNGTYTVTLYEGNSAGKYTVAVAQNITVSLSDSKKPFLYPNQYVNFNSSSTVVAKAKSLAKGTKTDLDLVEKCYDFTVKTLTYDYALAKSVSSGYIPDVDKVLAKKKGICFDYAAMMTAMLRSQGVPTKLQIGYTGKVYHAWISTYVDGQGWIDDVIFFDGKNWKLMDPTFASTSKSNKDFSKESYQVKYAY